VEEAPVAWHRCTAAEGDATRLDIAVVASGIVAMYEPFVGYEVHGRWADKRIASCHLLAAHLFVLVALRVALEAVTKYLFGIPSEDMRLGTFHGGATAFFHAALVVVGVLAVAVTAQDLLSASPVRFAESTGHDLASAQSNAACIKVHFSTCVVRAQNA